MTNSTSKKSKKESSSSFDQISGPCDFDHNGECWICDCWASECAFKRMIKGDERYESLEELKSMFKDFLSGHPRKKELENLIDSYRKN